MFDFGYEPAKHTDAQYFKNHHPSINIPITDVAAYQAYPEHQWLYNKILLCQAQNIWAYPDRISPPSFPIVHKPITNLYGMSAGVTFIYDQDTYDHMFKPGYMIMPLITGDQFTTDVVVINGEIQWIFSFVAHKDQNSCFTLWEAKPIPNDTYAILKNWIKQYFSSYVGVVNFETINQQIIECHPRMSSQYVDLYGGDIWIQAIIELYHHQHWTLIQPQQTGYSIPLRIHEKITCVFFNKTIEQAKQFCSSIQLFTDEGDEDHIDDEYSKRIAVVNCFNLEDGYAAANILKNNIITNNRSVTWI